MKAYVNKRIILDFEPGQLEGKLGLPEGYRIEKIEAQYPYTKGICIIAEKSEEEEVK